jgi:hypothetical protein
MTAPLRRSRSAARYPKPAPLTALSGVLVDPEEMHLGD